MLLVFDFDGTLVDSLGDLAESASELSLEYGGERLDRDTVARMVGEGAHTLVDRILAHAGAPGPQPDALNRFLQIYDRRMLNHTAPYAGMIETLGVLSRSHTLAVLTNKPEHATRRIMGNTGLDRFFGHCVFGDGWLPRKPAPEGLRWLMAQHGATADETWLVGDSDVDLMTARAAGVQACIVRFGFGFARIDAAAFRDDDVIIGRPEELIEALGGEAVGRG